MSGGAHTEVLVSLEGVLVFRILHNGLTSVENAGISGRTREGI